MIVEHIRTSAGPRFSTYERDEDRRVQLIQYYNEVHADEDNPELADDATLEEVVDAIEEFEDIDTEEIWEAPKLGLFMVQCDDENGENLDAIVEANNAAEAQQLWAAQWERDLTDPDINQPRIWQINPTGKPGVLGWNTMQLNRII
jgi:hypothetical protein